MKEKLHGLKEVVDFIKGNDDFMVLNDYDADGISAGAIIRKALDRLGKKYTSKTLQHFSKEAIRDHYDSADNLLLIDFGSGYLDMLEEEIKDKDYCIIDHHEIEGETEHPHLNPDFSGYDGSTQISSSGLSYLVARELSEENKDMSKMAIVGALGDMQHADENKLVSLNKEIALEGQEVGELEVKKDITLFGRNARPLISFLAYSSYPYFPGLTGNRRMCKVFLRKLGIPLKNKLTDEWRYYNDLSAEEKKKLISGLYVYGKRRHVPEPVLKNLIGEVYELKKEPQKSPLRDAKEFATVLNACGRHKEGEIGVRVAMGDREEYYDKAMSLLRKHRRELRKGIQYAEEEGAEELENLYTLDARGRIKHSLVGIVVGMLYSTKEVSRDKPILGIAEKGEGKVKVSGRANKKLVLKGVNLGEAMYKTSQELGGEGGGHDVAAGATVPEERLDEFLKKVDEEVGKQINDD